MSIPEHERTSVEVIIYALYLYFLGLSLRSTSKSLEPFIDRSHIDIWYWIHEFNPNDVFLNKKKARIIAFAIDETLIQIGDTDAWLWIAVEPIHYRILGVYISNHRNMLVTLFRIGSIDWNHFCYFCLFLLVVSLHWDNFPAIYRRYSNNMSSLRYFSTCFFASCLINCKSLLTVD